MKGNKRHCRNISGSKHFKVVTEVIGINLLKKMQPAHISTLHAGCLLQEIALSIAKEY